MAHFDWSNTFKAVGLGFDRRVGPFVVDPEAASRHNATKSRLLSLPEEVLRMICEYIVGNKLVHWRYRQWLKAFGGLTLAENSISLRTRICDKHFSLREGHQAWRSDIQAGSEPLGPTELVKYDHTCCDCLFPYTKDQVDTHHQDRYPLPSVTSDFHQNMAVLYTCKKLSETAANVLWSKNTFSFNCTPDIKEFINSRTGEQLRLIHSLHLDICLTRLDEERLDKPPRFLGVEGTRKFSGLRQLYVQINENGIPTDGPEHLTLKDLASRYIRNSKYLDLTYVSVVIDPTDFQPPDDVDDDNDSWYSGYHGNSDGEEDDGANEVIVLPEHTPLSNQQLLDWADELEQDLRERL